MDPIELAILKTEGMLESLPPTTFKMFTGLLKAHRRADGRRVINGVASSTVRDLHGDTMLASALEDMERDANGGMTIFLNHSYNVPEDVAGSVNKAQMRTRGVDGDGNPNWDLDFDEVLINEANPRAVAAHEGIEQGAKVGLSIGALIPEGGAVRNKKDGTLIISHVHLLETSIVGIPANPRSWIQNAMKSYDELAAAVQKAAVDASTTVPLGQPTLTLGVNGSYRIEGQLDAATLQPKATVPDVADAAPVEPDVTDAKIQVITIDTDDGKAPSTEPSAEASSSDPADEDYDSGSDAVVASATDAIAKSADSEVLVTHLQSVLKAFESTTAALVAERTKRIDAETAVKAAETSRDEAIHQAGLIVLSARDVIEKVASTPLGRKTTMKEAGAQLTHLESTYSPEFMKMLRSANTP